jgi:multiple sugar transport system permease protein
MAIWMTKNFMDSVPVSLEEAAWVDGAGSMTALRRIVVPLMRQGIAVVFIFVFTQAWGNFFVPFVLLFSPDNQPAAVAIYSFFGTYGTVAYGRLAAFSLLYSVPVLVLYLVVQRFSGGSFAMSGAVKG